MKYERDWDYLIEHADGRDCICAAYSSAECGCDADWTPKEVYEKDKRIAELEATVSKYREALEIISSTTYPGGNPEPDVQHLIDQAKDALKAIEGKDGV